jgi:hypothetical protein
MAAAVTTFRPVVGKMVSNPEVIRVSDALWFD